MPMTAPGDAALRILIVEKIAAPMSEGEPVQ